MISRISKISALFLLGAALSNGVQAQDTFENFVLHSPTFQAGDYLFRDLVVALPPGGVVNVLSVGPVIGPANQFNNAQVTSYDFATGKLTVPLVKINHEYYPDVLLTAPFTSPWTLDAIGNPHIIIGPDGPDTTFAFTVSPTSLSGVVGGSENLTLIGGMPSYTATSSNPAVATLVPITTGFYGAQVQYVGVGTSTITIWDRKGATLSVPVTVTAGAAGTLVLNPTSGSGKVGETLNFVVTGATNGVSVVSSNPSVAWCPISVSGSPATITCTLASIGETTLTVSSGTSTATGTITVSESGTPSGDTKNFFVYPTTFAGFVGDTLTITAVNGIAPYYLGGYDSRYVTLVGSSANTFTFKMINPTTAPSAINIMDATGKFVPVSVTISASAAGFQIEPAGMTGITAGQQVHIFMMGGQPPFTQVRPIEPEYFLVQQASEREFILHIKNGQVNFENYYLTFRDGTGAEATFVIDTVEEGVEMQASGVTEGYPGDDLSLTVTGGSPPYNVRSSNTNIVNPRIDEMSVNPAYASIKVSFGTNKGSLPATATVTITDSENSRIDILMTAKPRMPPI